MSQRIDLLRIPWVALSVTLLPLTGCGSGIFAIASESDPGPTGTTPVVASLSLQNSRVGPAQLHLRIVAEASSESLDVSAYFAGVDGLENIAGASGLVAAPAPGALHTIDWDFTDVFSPGRLWEDVEVFVAPRSQEEAQILQTAAEGVNFVRVDLGDAPPEVELEVAGVSAGAPDIPELSGIIALNLILRDSSNDEVDVFVEFFAADGSYQPARPAGFPDEEPTPTVSIGAVTALDSGTQVTFAWDSSADIAGAERETHLRVRLREVVAPNLGSPDVLSSTLSVDNNIPPGIELSAVDLVLSPDGVGGVALPLTVTDPDREPVGVLLQWTPVGEAFPPLPTTAEELVALREDPAMRRLLRIASEWPSTYTGILVSGRDAESVRLPELATTAAPLVSRNGNARLALVGRTLEVLAPGNRLRALPHPAERVQVQPLAGGPVSTGGEGISLESDGADGFRLVRCSLVSGSELELLAEGLGEPRLMTWEQGGEALLIVSSPLGASGGWEISRYSIEGGDLRVLILANDTVVAGTPRGLASLAPGECYLSVEKSIVRINYGVSVSSAVFRDYARSAVPTTPWGLAVDPRVPRGLFCAHPDHDRIVTIDVDTGEESPLPLGAVRVARPTALILDGHEQLFVITDEDNADGELELASLLLEPELDRDDDGHGELALDVLERGLPQGTPRLGLAGETRTLVLAEAGTSFAGGGVEQVRTITDFDPSESSVSLDRALDPVAPGRRWRIHDRVDGLVAEPDGTRVTFTWDTSDVSGESLVLLRAIAFDQDAGPISSSVPRELAPSEILRNVPFNVTPGSSPRWVDLDGDGDRDVVLLRNSPVGLELYEQARPRTFQFAGSLPGNAAFDLAADFNGDGYADLAHAGSIRLQDSGAPFTFLSGVSLGQRVSAVGDLDRDGNLDALVLATECTTVYMGQGDGSFQELPVDLDRRTGVAVGDLDLDGLLDLVMLGPGSFAPPDSLSYGDRVEVHLQRETNLFESVSDYRFIVGDFVRDFELDDIDGNGTLDLALAKEDSGTDPGEVRIYLDLHAQGQAGGFQPSFVASPAFDALDSIALQLADLDQDGHRDLIVTNLAGGTNNVGQDNTVAYDQTSPGSFDSTPRRLSDFNVFFDLKSEAFLDVDGDGRIDRTGSPVRFRESLRVFVAGGGLVDPLGNMSRCVADFDRDGDADILWVAGSSADELRLYPQSRYGDSSNRRTFATSPLKTLRSGDLDGDGDIDVAALGAVGNGNAVVTVLQSAAGLSEDIAIRDAFISGEAHELGIFDIDGDGTPELLVGADVHQLFQRRVNGYVEVARFGRGADRELGDIDADGDLDVIEADAAGLLLHEQTEPFTFVTRTLLAGISDPPRGLFDVDVDGRVDATLAGAGIDVWFQEPDRGFTPVKVVASASIPGTPLELDDVDRNGLPDVLAHGLGPELLLQASPRLFRAFLPPGGLGSARGIYVDYDGDGRKDFVDDGLFGSEELTIYFGER